MLHFSRTWSASSSLCVLSSCALLFFLLSASAAASMPVTFKGTVAMVDGRIDPATVKVVLSQRTGEGTKDVSFHTYRYKRKHTHRERREREREKRN